MDFGLAQVLATMGDNLDDVFSLTAGLFSRVELRRRARSYLVGLRAPVERKNSWQLAEAAGDADPWRVQHFRGIDGASDKKSSEKTCPRADSDRDRSRRRVVR